MVTESEFSRLHKTFRGLWTVCIFAVALMFIVSVAYTVPRYLEYPVSYDVAMVTSQKLPFPAVTLCNTNRFRKSEIEDSRFRDLLLLDRPAGLSNLMPYVGPCFHGDFPCDENATECVKHYMKCNGQDECRNGADERDCTGIGEPEMDDEMFCVTDTKFPCNNSKCIPSELTCDYIDNCGDFSDEDNCTYLADCGSDSFQCSSNEGEVHCIPGYLRCDRIKHCRNGKDEDGCEYPTNTGFFDVFAENWTHPYHDITTASRYYDKFREDVYLPNLIDFVSNDTSPSLIPLLLASTSPTFDDVRAALMMTAGEMHQFGHQADDAILECSYNGMECETEDFTVSQHENFGNCFTFNNKDKGRLKVEKPGPAHGLELLLSAELYEYVGVYGGRSGFKVVINDRDVMPFPDIEGFYASPGTFISASLESSVISRLSAPYGDCSSDFSSVKECEAMCLVKHVEDYCGCRPADVMEEMADNNTTEICDRRNQTQDMCLQLMKYFSTRGLLTCDCRLPCSETKYRSTITQSPWPSSKYVPYLLNSLHFSNNKTWTLTDETSVSNNLVSLEVYFETLSEQHVTAEPAYTMSALMMDVGLFLAIWMTLALLVVVLGYVCCGPKGETGQEADEVKVNHVDNVKNANSVNVSLDEITEQDTMDTKL